ncbi:MAG: hypothetical protein UHG68_01825, partial [Clostridia bacterium]|nr:hypothetical protein [Clostridia bacterium]
NFRSFCQNYILTSAFLENSRQNVNSDYVLRQKRVNFQIPCKDKRGKIRSLFRRGSDAAMCRFRCGKTAVSVLFYQSVCEGVF